MRLQQLRLLHAVAEHETVEAAAEAEQMKAAAMQRSLLALEQVLGFALIRRAGRRIVLTETGIEVAQRAREVMTHLAEIQRIASNDARRGAGRSVVVAVGSILERTLAPMIADRAARAPQLAVTFRSLSDGRSGIRLVQSAEVDLAIVDCVDLPDDVVALGSIRIEFGLLAPSDHDFGERVPMSLLPSLPLFALSGDDLGAPSTDQLMRDLGVTPRYVMSTVGHDVWPALVGAGHGYAVVPLFSIDERVDGAVVVPFEPSLVCDVSIIHAPDRVGPITDLASRLREPAAVEDESVTRSTSRDRCAGRSPDEPGATDRGDAPLAIPHRERMVKLQQLRYLVAFGDHGTMSSAASYFPVAQPVLSRALRAMESNLGVHMFRNDGRRVALTDVGEAILHFARLIVLELDEIEAMGDGSAPTPLAADPVIIASLAIWEQVIAGAIVRTGTWRSTLPIAIRNASTDADSISLIRRRRADLAIVEAHTESTGMVVRPLATVETGLMCPEGHSLPTPIPLSELSNLPLLSILSAGHDGDGFDVGLNQSGAVMKIAVATGDRSSWPTLIRHGYGFALSALSERDHPPAGVVVVPFDPPMANDLVVVHRREVSRSALAVLDQLVALMDPGSEIAR